MDCICTPYCFHTWYRHTFLFYVYLDIFIYISFASWILLCIVTVTEFTLPNRAARHIVDFIDTYLFLSYPNMHFNAE